MSNELEQKLLTKVEDIVQKSSERLAKIEEKLQTNGEQLIRMEGKIDGRVCNEIKHMASDIKEIKSLGQSLNKQELLLAQHQQELNKIPQMSENITAHDREIHKIKGIFTIAPFITAIVAAIATAAAIKIL